MIAATSLRSLAKGEKISPEQKKALVGVAKDVAVSAAFAAISGGAGAPMSKVFGLFASNVAQGVLKSSVMKGVMFGSRVSAKGLDDDTVMMRFIESVAEKLATEVLSPEQWATLVDEANASK